MLCILTIMFIYILYGYIYIDPTTRPESGSLLALYTKNGVTTCKLDTVL